MNIEKFKPDETGKFSPLLYRWLSGKRAQEGRLFQVFQRTNVIDGEGYRDYLVPNEIIIGRSDPDGFISGRSLGSIIRGERGPSASVFAFAPSFGLRNITDTFWKEYEHDGRCAWDQQHHMGMVGDAKRFDTSKGGLTRACNWCGRKFRGKRRVRVERYEFIDWKEIAA